MNNFGVKKAFTLAEVLITLAIIGVVAALTIPVLINNVNKAGYVSALQKNYALLQQTFLMLQTENGGSILPIVASDTTTNQGNGAVLNAFLTKLNYVKNCGTAKGCWYDSPRNYLDGTVANPSFDTDISGTNEKAILSNGAMIFIGIVSTDCTNTYGTGPIQNAVCAGIGIDVNGAKGPNTGGRDFFGFYLTKTGIYPQGIFNDVNSCGLGNNWDTTMGCVSKVIKEGAMNY